jgi:hypothetical protein
MLIVWTVSSLCSWTRLTETATIDVIWLWGAMKGFCMKSNYGAKVLFEDSSFPDEQPMSAMPDLLSFSVRVRK